MDYWWREGIKVFGLSKTFKKAKEFVSLGGMTMKKKKLSFSGNHVTVLLLIVALTLVSLNYLQTMNLMVEIEGQGTTGAFASGDTRVVPREGALPILEFSDFQCPFCGRAYPAVKQLLDKYGDQIDFQYKHFPLRNIHPDAQKAAEAAECARDQGQFFLYHDALFQTQVNLQVSALKELAQKLELDVVKFSKCLDSGEKADLIEADLQEGIQKGVSGTPTFFIGDEKIGGAVPFETLDAAVQRQLAR